MSILNVTCGLLFVDIIGIDIIFDENVSGSRGDQAMTNLIHSGKAADY